MRPTFDPVPSAFDPPQYRRQPVLRLAGLSLPSRVAFGPLLSGNFTVALDYQAAGISQPVCSGFAPAESFGACSPLTRTKPRRFRAVGQGSSTLG